MDDPRAQALAAIPEDLLRRMDVPGPRYTSYPTADRFVEAFGPAEHVRALQERRRGVRVGGAVPLSVYVHVPFCESVCYYCACNKIVTRHHDRAHAYLYDLESEIRLHTGHLGEGEPLSQLHFGGGSPTFLHDEEIERLMSALRAAFRILPGAELSIEVDPRTVTARRLEALARQGFNRISFGVQDVDPDVQQAIHRVQPVELVRELMQAARGIGFDSINADLIYGLPRQTPASFARTVSQVAALRPDRIALYAYAHLPERFKPQRRIAPSELPAAHDRLAMLSGAIAGFLSHGYVYIGMDHFALPGDPLAVARRQGRLHRNFQGYSTQPDCDLVALGVSAIGRMGATYSQNAKTLPEYHDAIHHGRLATVRGIELSRDDVLRRAVIMALMCQGRLDFESLEVAHMVDPRAYFAPELERLRAFAAEGLVEVDDEAIQVTARGWFFVRGIAMVFDRHLQSREVRARFSRII
jgi:oxygen-independent coproporphyrinogen-3 oxidase